MKLIFNSEVISSSINVRDGEPCINGTRLPIKSLIAELTEGKTYKEIADDFDVDPEILKQILFDVASCVTGEAPF